MVPGMPGLSFPATLASSLARGLPTFRKWSSARCRCAEYLPFAAILRLLALQATPQTTAHPQQLKRGSFPRQPWPTSPQMRLQTPLRPASSTRCWQQSTADSARTAGLCVCRLPAVGHALGAPLRRTGQGSRMGVCVQEHAAQVRAGTLGANRHPRMSGAACHPFAVFAAMSCLQSGRPLLIEAAAAGATVLVEGLLNRGADVATEAPVSANG